MTNLQIAKLYLATNATATSAQIDTAVTDGTALTAINALSATAFLEASYQAAFGRSVDADGTAAYLTKLTDGTLTKDGFAAILNAGAAIYPSTGAFVSLNTADKAVIVNKTTVETAADTLTVGATAVQLKTVTDVATTATVAVEAVNNAEYTAALTAYNTAVTTAAASKAAADTAALTVSTVALATASKTAATTAKTDADAVVAKSALLVTAATATVSAADDITAAATTATAATAQTAAATVLTTATAAVTTTTDAATAAAAVGSTFTLTTSDDIFAGTAKSDTFTAASGTLAATDVIVDTSVVDNDTITVTETLAGAVTTVAATISGIENVNFNINSFAASTVTATNISNAKTITADMTQSGGSTAVTVTGASNTVAVVAGSHVTSLTATYGATNGSGGKAVTGSALTTTVIVNNTDADGVVITTGVAGNTTTALTITVDGTAGTTDAATISADGLITLSTGGTDEVETLNLSGKTATATYTATAGDVPNTVNFTGAQNVTYSVKVADITAKTFTNALTAGTATLKLITAAATMDATHVATSAVIDMAVDFGGITTTLATGAHLKFSATQAATVLTAAAAGIATNTAYIDFNHNTVGALATTNLEDIYMSNSSIVAATGLSDTVTITSGNFVNTTDLIISGAGAFTFATNVIADSIQGAAMTGKLTVTTTATGVDTITSGSANDSLTMGFAGTNTATTGAGNDTVIFGAGVTIATVTAGAGDDIIDDQSVSRTVAGVTTINGGDGTDTVKLDAAASTVYTAANLILTDVEVININAASTVAGTTLSGKSYIITGATNVLTATADSSSLDFSGVSFDSATAGKGVTITASALASTILGSSAGDIITGNTLDDSLTGNAGDDTIDGDAGNDTISGGAGIDNLLGKAGNDTITGGEGADIITGGTGNDTINLTETVAAIDNLQMTAVATNGVDTITGFAAGDGIDTISVVKSDTEAQTAGATGDVLVLTSEATALVTGGGTFDLAGSSATDGMIEITTILDDDVILSATSTGTDLLQALSSDATAAGSITVSTDLDIGFLTVYQNGNAYVWHYIDSATAGVLTLAADVSLVAIVNGVAVGGLASGDFLLV